jgi:protein-S-isoprenylcysteine O-methyltransferase Ste14
MRLPPPPKNGLAPRFALPQGESISRTLGAVMRIWPAAAVLILSGCAQNLGSERDFFMATDRAEENLLRAHFGAAYESYRARTARLVPGLY